MVARQSQPVSFGSSVAAGQLQGSQLGSARVDPMAAQATPDTVDIVLGALVPSMNKLANTALETGLEEAYLNGVSTAATKQSEEALGQNPITADWERAGYRDTMGRLAHADAEAKLLQDMPRLRQLTPEQFQQELGKRRASLLPQLEGMSRKQRESMLQQFAASEFTSIKQHAAEHQKYIVETRLAGIQAQARSSVALLNSSRDKDLASYAGAIEKFQLVMENLANDDAIPGEAKGKAAKEIAAFALQSDHLRVYDTLMEPQWGDKPNPMLQYLSFDDSVALSQAARQAEERTEGLRSMTWQNQDAAISAKIAGGELPDEREYDAHLQEGLRLRFISGGQYNSLKEEYFKQKMESGNSHVAAAAARAGDKQTLFNLGVSDEKAVQMFEASVRGQPLTAVVPQLIDMSQKGMAPAGKRAGELTAGAWSELQFSPEKMLPENVKLLEQTVAQLDLLESQGKKAGIAGYLSAFDEGTRSFVEQYRLHRKTGASHTAAASKASEALKLHQGKTLQQKASGLAADQSWKDFKDAQTSWFRTPGNALAWAKDFVGIGENNVLMRNLTIGTGAFPGEKGEAFARAALAPIWSAVMEEAEKEAIRNPGNAGEPAFNIALAEVAGKRIIPTAQTPVLIPANVNIKALLGANASHSLSDVGRAIDRLGQPAKGFRRVYEMDRFGNLRYRDWNDKGQQGSEQIVTPAAIRQSLLDMDVEATGKASKVYGPGKTVKQGNAAVTFNGNNTAGVRNELAFEFRESLIRFEGVRDTAYADLSGKGTTVGVGIHSSSGVFPKGVQPGQKISQEQINQTFMQASDSALRQGKNAAVQLGVYNNAGILFASQLAFQAGNWVSPKHPDPAMRELTQAIAKRDKDAAIAAFERTTAAKYGEGRREWYKYQIRKMLG